MVIGGVLVGCNCIFRSGLLWCCCYYSGLFLLQWFVFSSEWNWGLSPQEKAHKDYRHIKLEEISIPTNTQTER
jgi:hypothetical protein